MNNIYFVGAGGIGMANLERYFLRKGKNVAGYDRTRSDLTIALENEGAELIYDDNPELIPLSYRNPDDTLVVYTPAIPSDSPILNWFRNHGFKVVKRAVLLGEITRDTRSICIAGSHGKTTTSSMVANILRESETGCNAFLGGVLRNTGSNFVICEESDWSVIEADEYDRSFHNLTPYIAVVTSVDPDHLDIYGDEAGYREGFAHFTSLIKTGGCLLMRHGIPLIPRVKEGVEVMTYSGGENGDWHAEDITFGKGTVTYTLIGPGIRIEGMEPGVPVEINIENSVAAAAAALIAGASADEVKRGIATFMGAKRRFEIYRKGIDGSTAFVDDYAHSPNEVKASICSVRKLFPGRKLSVVFQPHLYSRTRDFADEFALALSEADEVILPEIYPAREKPIPGVTSALILEKIKSSRKQLCDRENLLNLIKKSNFDILMTMGAADIELLIPGILEIIDSQKSHTDSDA